MVNEFVKYASSSFTTISGALLLLLSEASFAARLIKSYSPYSAASSSPRSSLSDGRSSSARPKGLAVFSNFSVSVLSTPALSRGVLLLKASLMSESCVSVLLSEFELSPVLTPPLVLVFTFAEPVLSSMLVLVVFSASTLSPLPVLSSMTVFSFSDSFELFPVSASASSWPFSKLPSLAAPSSAASAPSALSDVFSFELSSEAFSSVLFSSATLSSAPFSAAAISVSDSAVFFATAISVSDSALFSDAA